MLTGQSESYLLPVTTYAFATPSGYSVSCIVVAWKRDLGMIYKLYAHPNTVDEGLVLVKMCSVQWGQHVVHWLNVKATHIDCSCMYVCMHCVPTGLCICHVSLAVSVWMGRRCEVCSHPCRPEEQGWPRWVYFCMGTPLQFTMLCILSIHYHLPACLSLFI